MVEHVVGCSECTWNLKKNCIIICSNECSVDNIYLSVRALEFYIEWPAQSIQISTSSNPEPCSKVYGKNSHYDH